MAAESNKPEPQDQWEHDVWLMGRRMALLYHYMAKAIIDEAGEARGKEIIKDAIWKYGRHCGDAVGKGVDAQGLPRTAENFRKVPDLPSRGWRSEVGSGPDGKPQHRTVLCPLAVTWKELGEDALGRIYCFVDQAKTEAYNPCLECVHVHNVLDGDGFCEIVMRPKK